MKGQRKPFEFIEAQIEFVAALDLIEFGQWPIERLGQADDADPEVFAEPPYIAGKQLWRLGMPQPWHAANP